MTRFHRRWRLVGAGLSNVWRFGDLDLPANSGRLLLRGPNGTGKTTALEALWPFLLDLDATRLAAGKARPTSLPSLMREGASGKRRYGYAWMTLADPAGALHSFGVRLQYSDGGSPPVRVVPFTIPGRPLHDMPLYLAGKATLTTEQFDQAVAAHGGQVFADQQAYVAHLAARVFETNDTHELQLLAQRLRQLRNPSLLGEVSAQAAADALRDSLPGVSEDTITATAEALEESKTTREAFERDRMAAELLGELAAAWSGHAVDVVVHVHETAAEANKSVTKAHQQVRKLVGDLKRAGEGRATASELVVKLEDNIAANEAELTALKQHEAYKEAELRDELANRLRAEDRQAEIETRNVTRIADSLRNTGRSLREQLGTIIEDIAANAAEVAAADPSLRLATPLVAWKDIHREPVRVGDLRADPGPALVISGDAERLRAVSKSWDVRAQEHKRHADSAALALRDHRPVAEALNLAADEQRTARELAEEADRRSQTLHVARTGVAAAAHALKERLDGWCRTHPTLVDDIDLGLLSDAEPVRVLAFADDWALEVTKRAEARAAELRAIADRETSTATTRRAEAAHLRSKAAELRAGLLLPLPRPSWADPADDATAFGTAVEWSPAVLHPHERDLIEAALAAAGVLGATLQADGLRAGTWHVAPAGPVIDSNLTEVLTIDPAHPLGAIAQRVLERIALADSAPSADAFPGVTIGRDGTFRAGVLFGRVPGAIDPLRLEAASHIGATQRRAAALAQAAEFERQADVAEADALECGRRAIIAQDDAAMISDAGRAYPARADLQRAESRRAEVENLAMSAQRKAAEAQDKADRRGSEAAKLRTEWIERTRSLGLPTDVEKLTQLAQDGRSIAERIQRAAQPLGARFADRLQRVLDEFARPEASTALDVAAREALAAAQNAAATRRRLEVLEETMGDAITDIMKRYDAAREAGKRLRQELGPARTAHTEAVGEESAVRSKLDNANEALDVLVRTASDALLALQRLFEVPGVADAAVGGAPLPADADLLAFVESKVTGRKTRAKKSVRELADHARAQLAGTWAIDAGEDHGELLTWVCTHRDTSYSPLQAAAYAIQMKERAERALAASEERALRDFVIGRLPAAIGTAWTRLHDWINDVNRKMKSASASSGVGVQVRTPVSTELAAHERVVYELSCKISDATRTADQQRDLATALQAVIFGAEDASMRERVARATDVRQWLDVYYEVTRGDKKTQRWGLRTGLSTGERRLVVLAPMLAAIAAQYERFGERALRLVALDEIPVEVDERGRDGLARYIAQLDLDLVCTSHQWDGCPGAWDGIDAHELEAGPDQTVVAFPMIVRGSGPLPGDPAWRTP